jgi:thiol-disulfide isomerase/thioredoxin
MKWHRIFLLFVFITSAVIIPYTAASDKTDFINSLNGERVYVYFFYFTQHCDECLIVEQALLKVLNEYYFQELKNKRLIYKKINLTDPDPESKKIAQELKVRRQLLLVVSGDTVINLTRDAFRFAETRYEQFCISTRKAIDQELSQ